jgi:hypothetical protein
LEEGGGDAEQEGGLAGQLEVDVGLAASGEAGGRGGEGDGEGEDEAEVRE